MRFFGCSWIRRALVFCHLLTIVTSVVAVTIHQDGDAENEQAALCRYACLGELDKLKELLARGRDNLQLDEICSLSEGSEDAEEREGEGEKKKEKEKVYFPTLSDWPNDFGAAIHYAAAQGHTEVVKELLAQGASPNRQTARSKNSVLSVVAASRKSSVEVLETLLSWPDANIEVNYRDEDDLTPLMLAAMYDHVEIVKRLLQVDGIEVNVADKINARTALMRAAEADAVETVKVLLEVPGIDVNFADQVMRQTALVFAAQNGCSEVVRLLVEHEDTDVNYKDGFYRKPMLILAAQKNNVAVVKELVKSPALLLNLVDLDGMTALMYAADGNYHEVMELLVNVRPAERLDPNVQHYLSEHRTALSFAAARGHRDCIDTLFQVDSLDPNLGDRDQKRPIMYALDAPDTSILEDLLSRDKVKPDEREEGYNLTVLHLALQLHKGPMVLAILDSPHKLLLNAVEVNGKTPLMLAAEWGELQIVIHMVDALRDAGADLDLTDQVSGATAMILAVKNEKCDAVSAILSGGANSNVQDWAGRTAAMYAAMIGDEMVLFVLINSYLCPDLSLHDKKRWTVLHHSVGHANIIKRLTGFEKNFEKTCFENTVEADKNRLNVNAKTDDGSTALILACKNDRTSASVEALLLVPSVDLNLLDEAGIPAIFYAIRKGNEEAVEKLCTASGSSYRRLLDSNLQDEEGRTALTLAVEEGNAGMIKTLQEQSSADPNHRTKDGRTVLMLAASLGKAPVIWALLRFTGERALDLDAVTEEGQTALMIAAQQNQIDAIRSLLEPGMLDFGADPWVKDKENRTALTFAILQNWTGATSTLLRHNPQLLNVKINPVEGVLRTPLMQAVLSSTVEMVRIIVDFYSNVEGEQTNVNDQDEAGRTALSQTVRMAGADGAIEKLKLLLKLEDLDCSLTDKDGLSAVDYASRQTDGIYLQLLLRMLQSGTAKEKAASDALGKALERWNYTLASFFQENGGKLNPSMSMLARQAAFRLAVLHSDLPLAEEALKARDAAAATTADDARAYSVKLRELPEHCKTTTTTVSRMEQATYGWASDDIDAKQETEREDDSAPPVWPTCCTFEECQDLLPMASTGAIVHLILDQMVANNEDLEAPMHEALVFALSNGKVEAAVTLFARNASLGTVPMGKTPNAEVEHIIEQSKSWNRLHWAAKSHDIHAVVLTFSELWREQKTALAYRLLTSKTGDLDQEHNSMTPIDIAEKEKDESPDIFIILQNFAAINKGSYQVMRSSHFRDVIAGCVSLVLGAGSLLVHIFILRFKTLRSKGLAFTMMLPSIFLMAVLLQAYCFKYTGSDDLMRGSPPDSPEEKRIKLLTWLGIGLASLLVLLVPIVTLSPRLQASVNRLKESAQLWERCWEIVNLQMWALAVVILMLGEAIQSGGGFAIYAGLVEVAVSAMVLNRNDMKHIAATTRSILGVSLLILNFAFSALGYWGLSSSWACTALGSTLLALGVMDLGGTVRRVVEVAQTHVFAEIELCTMKTDKFVAPSLVFGSAEVAALGLQLALGLSTMDIAEGLKDPIKAMREEVRTQGSRDDLENFDYIVEGISGDPDCFPSAVTESLRSGVYHGGTLRPNEFDTGHEGRTLDDWMNILEVKLSQVSKAEFVAVRFYTSSSFRMINGPLRAQVTPHPWRMVVHLLDQGIKKLRAVQAQVDPERFAGSMTLWRGMKNLAVDVGKFKSLGGTELAPMSTTSSKEVASHYAQSKMPLLFKYAVSGMRTGVSVQFLSLYPKEEEYLYPPLTFLSLKRHYEDDDERVYVVEPVMS